MLNYICNFINYKFNKTVRFFTKKQKDTNRKILIFASSYSPFGNMKQRPEHLFEQFIRNNYIIAWSDKAVNRVIEISPNIYVFPLKHLETLCLTSNIKNKIIMSISTHYTCNNLENILIKASKKHIPIIYEHLDDIELQQDSKIKEKLYKRFYKIAKIKNIVISTTADTLYNQALDIRKTKKNIILAKNAVNLNNFIPNGRLCSDFQNILNKNQPIIGYYGCIVKEWFDFDMLEYAIKENPNLQFVIIGMHRQNEIEHLKKYNNFLCIDKLNFEELINYAKHFSVATIPFKINEITKGTSPVKMFEYMALGLPIVTTALPECKLYKSCNIAHSKEEFSKLINYAIKLKEDTKYQNILYKEAKENTWETTYNKIIKAIS